jgi:hypothetical protein
MLPTVPKVVGIDIIFAFAKQGIDLLDDNPAIQKQLGWFCAIYKK